MQYEYILMAIPVIIIVAFLVLITKRMVDRERPDISNAVLGTIIIAVGLLIMVPIISSVDPQYAYDEDDRTFTLYKNVTGTEFSWGSAANAESLIIEDTVTTISAGAFASFTDLKYISIPESLETIGEGAFPTLKDCFDQTIAEPDAGEYVGAGDGTLYQYVDMFTYNGPKISGLSSDYSEAVNLVLPSSHNGTAIEGIQYESFRGKIAIKTILVSPGSSMTSIGSSAMRDCSSLSLVVLPDTVLSIATSAFYGCTSLASIDLPESLQSIGNSTFRDCTALESLTFPESLQSIDQAAFYGCTSLASIDLPSSVNSIGIESFRNCTGITSVKFAEGFGATLSSSWCPWTFYDFDGTTAITKTDATALAGFTFQGTASALVKVLPDRSALTLEQTLKVQELTKAAEKASKLEEADLQISEKTDLAEA